MKHLVYVRVLTTGMRRLPLLLTFPTLLAALLGADTVLPSGIAVYTDAAEFSSYVSNAGSRLIPANSATYGGNNYVNGPPISIYERDTPAVGLFNCGTNPSQPACNQDGLYGFVSGNPPVWTDHLFTKSPSDPTIVDNIAGAVTDLNFDYYRASNYKPVGFASDIALGPSATPMTVTFEFGFVNNPIASGSDSYILSPSYDGFFGIIIPANFTLGDVVFSDHDSAGANLQLTNLYAANAAPEPQSLVLLAFGAVALFTGVRKREARRMDRYKHS